ncbi:5-formyltetrahydrofolate cyclo-ligase [Flagellimonas sp. S174]|uniref:5-formyltetrahydrofolate cyclo-ligase n=1 Tax=Flagellimonas sp. S174 TaxID=3410790 RepID=UPI003BF58900
MLKHELRNNYKVKRAHLSSDEIEIKSISLVNQILQIPIWDFFYFHTFLSIVKNKEVDTLPLITLLQGRDKHIVVPKMMGELSLEHYLLTDNTQLKPNKWSIPEPVDGIEIPVNKIEVVFIPLLAFDELGNRVGYGKGFYDEFLSECNPKTVKIGLSLFEAETEQITDIRKGDIGLDYCATPNKVYKF